MNPWQDCERILWVWEVVSILIVFLECGQDESIKSNAVKGELYCNVTLSFYTRLSTVIVMVHSIVLCWSLVLWYHAASVLQVSVVTTLNCSMVTTSSSACAYRIGQVECLKSLQDQRCSSGSWDLQSWKLQQRCIKICPQATHNIPSWAIELSENSPQLRTMALTRRMPTSIYHARSQQQSLHRTIKDLCS